MFIVNQNPITVFLKSICQTKKILSRDYVEEYFPSYFVLLRFLSFLQTDDKTKGVLMEFVNNNLNCLPFDDKYDQYLYLLNTFPKIGHYRSKYIKREQVKIDKELQKKIDFFAETLELSKRDCKYLINEGYLNLNIKELKL